MKIMKEMSVSLMYEKRRNNEIIEKKPGFWKIVRILKLAVVEQKETKESESDISDITLSQKPCRDTQFYYMSIDLCFVTFVCCARPHMCVLFGDGICEGRLVFELVLQIHGGR